MNAHIINNLFTYHIDSGCTAACATATQLDETMAAAPDEETTTQEMDGATQSSEKSAAEVGKGQPLARIGVGVSVPLGLRGCFSGVCWTSNITCARGVKGKRRSTGTKSQWHQRRDWGIGFFLECVDQQRWEVPSHLADELRSALIKELKMTAFNLT